MCGITGFLDFSCKSGTTVLGRMTHSLRHRGPDDYRLQFIAEVGCSVGLGHTRLAILDLSPLANQPMEFDDLIICYNGEVYNFVSIRRELENYGYQFTSNSDTEVVLKAFHKWGHDCTKKFRGMWAFAIYNRKEKALILCRDRMGVKPLYWYFDGSVFLFASELKAFAQHPQFSKEVASEGVELFFRYGYISAPHTIYKNTSKLEPGSYLLINKNKDIRKERYWNYNECTHSAGSFGNLSQNSEQELLETLEQVLTESFKLRLVSDTPVGIFLSGGVDSSLVTALLQKDLVAPLKTFTIGFNEEEYNEAGWAKKVSAHFGTEHTELYCTSDDAFKIVPELPILFDEPFADSSAIPTYLLSRLAGDQVKVSLSADGGDELFGGYPWYSYFPQLLQQASGIRSQIFRALAPIVQKILLLSKKIGTRESHATAEYYWNKLIKARTIYRVKEIQEKYDLYHSVNFREQLGILGIPGSGMLRLSKNVFSGYNDISSGMMAFDAQTYLPDDILVKIDRTAMGVSLEGREPFLDPKILEFAAQIPTRFKTGNYSGKELLKKILVKYLPPELVYRPKQGFNIPVHEWFGDDLSGLYRERLSEENVGRHGILDGRAVSGLVDDYLGKRSTNSHRIWLMFTFQLWCDEYLS